MSENRGPEEGSEQSPVEQLVAEWDHHGGWKPSVENMQVMVDGWKAEREYTRMLRLALDDNTAMALLDRFVAYEKSFEGETYYADDLMAEYRALKGKP